MLGMLCVLLMAVGGSPPVHSQQDDNYVLFADDFENDQLAGWEPAAAWAVERPTTNALYISRQPGISWVQDGADWDDYVFRANTRVDSGTLALSFRYSSDGRYIVQLRPEGVLLTKEYPAGNFVTLAQAAPAAMQSWNTVVIGCMGQHMQVYINGQLVLDHTDPDALLQGTVAVGALDGTFAGVDNVLVMRLVRDLPAGDVSDPPPPPAPVQPGDPPQQPPTGGYPDVAIVEGTASPGVIVPGETTHVTVTLENTGSQTVDNFDLVVIPNYSPDGPNNPGHLQPVPTLAPGEQVTLEVHQTFYYNVGQYMLRVLATDQWYTTGNPEPIADNARDFPLTVQESAGGGDGAAQADIVIDDVTARALESPAGGADINITVRNAGSMDAGPFTVRWYPHAAQDVVGCSEDIALPAGESAVVRCMYVYPRQGEMHFRAVVDADNDITESSERNNTYQGTVTIAQGGGTAQTDLIISDVTARALESPAGGADINITVTNTGSVDAGLFTVRWYPHAAQDVVGCSEDIALPAGESAVVRCMYVYPRQGEMHFRAVVDADNDITESSERNNTYQGTVTIAQGGDPGASDGGQTGGTLPPPPAPVNCTAQALSATEIGIRWEYTGSGHSGFRIFQAGTSLEANIQNPDARQAKIGNLAANTQYHFDVRAVNSNGTATSPPEACAVDVTTQP